MDTAFHIIAIVDISEVLCNLKKGADSCDSFFRD